jgi:hypothetical protein
MSKDPEEDLMFQQNQEEQQAQEDAANAGKK